ncbi:unnamed protein product [Blumeria hordei]|uniref:Uncharacterized protein n=2 Tax=Blumeria hordei TaxID=2867405 RepID=A0A383UYB9_BLUHO|nr:hypothetical protein BGHDH14_bgh02638 [Blumeria hordei DH14]SZF04380.1 unnamed protein product [Blumeria hordei]
MSDEELDLEWKTSNRPQSKIAQNFSIALNELFKIDNSLSDLDAAVCEKKKALSSQTSELEALEARLKATEERLKAAGVHPCPPIPASQESPRQRVAFQNSITSPAMANFARTSNRIQQLPTSRGQVTTQRS